MSRFYNGSIAPNRNPPSTGHFPGAETMTDLKGYIRQLRNAADALETLLGFRDGPAVAAEIRSELSTNGVGQGYRGGPPKGFKYNGTHWTQSPKGRAHMRRLQALRHAKKGKHSARGANISKGMKKSRHHKGLHWTQ